MNPAHALGFALASITAASDRYLCDAETAIRLLALKTLPDTEPCDYEGEGRALADCAEAVDLFVWDRRAARLFNCWTAHAVPDWSRYDGLFLGGCIDHGGETEGSVSCDRAQFFTIYGRRPDGLAEAITDSPRGVTVAEARALGAEVAAVARLTLTDCPFLKARD